MASKKKTRRRAALIAVAAAFILLALAALDCRLIVRSYEIEAEEIDTPLRIALVTDLHSCRYGEGQEKLIRAVDEQQPDIILLGGDIFDDDMPDDNSDIFLAGVAGKYPCYYVTGNHEARVNEYGALKAGMEAAGVTVLEDVKTKISMEGETITLIGVNDPSYQTDYLFGDSETVMNTKLEDLHTEHDGFTILLSHRPELFDTYVDQDIDLVLSGHAHGGQFRLPFIGGLVAPNQGLFPEYDAGIYTEGNTNMLISRGVGNSILPFRINNRPEVILIELQAE